MNGQKQKGLAALLGAILLLLPGAPVLAHGVELSYETVTGVQITAVYDTGEPMDNAQVAVFAPGNLREPWLTGNCDERGNFFFTPDPAQPGLWEVRVRQAGHGGMIRFQVEESGVALSPAGGFTALQKIVMAAAVIWGLAGTALYFNRRKC